MNRFARLQVTVAELLGVLFNVVLVVMIVATMVSAGFTTTFADIGKVLSKVVLLVLVLVTGLVLRPAVGWALAELFSLDTPAYIAMVLLAVVPGAPLGVKFVMGARREVRDGRSRRRHDRRRVPGDARRRRLVHVRADRQLDPRCG